MKQEFIFLGPPACGKGTQTSKLSEFLGYPHIDTGSLLRAEIARETEEGKIAKFHIDQGHLVPLDLVATIIAKRLSQDDCNDGYVLDGYPRSMEQAEKLVEINNHVDREQNVSFKAIYFDIDTELLIDRIVNRQSCPKCGEIYNKKFKPSKVENICNKCNVPLKTRDDDNAEIARARFDTYFEQTAPLIDFYKEKGVLYKIDANGSIDEVWKRLLNVVES
ncbi:MAG: nucleoside monophosphate kinase [bacterium]|nr:nucleoside monophosphate kinase [bacterium]